jgi:hypothetical protein
LRLEGPYNQGGGSGGRIAIYASTYSFSGSLHAFGGSGPATVANAAAGTIYTEIGPPGNVYRRLLVDNNNLPTQLGSVYAAFSDVAALGAAVNYYVDELRIVRLGAFAIQQSDSFPYIRTVLSVQVSVVLKQHKS